VCVRVVGIVGKLSEDGVFVGPRGDALNLNNYAVALALVHAVRWVLTMPW
jgi:hypothetical protein